MSVNESHPEPDHMEWGDGTRIIYWGEGEWVQFDPEADIVDLEENR